MIKKTKTKYVNKFHYYDTDEVIGKSIDVYGEYSESEVIFLTSCMNKKTVVYDIGGNIGYHASAFATFAKHVYSFEPNLKNFSLLMKNTESFNNVTLINAAVTDKNTVLTIDDYNINVPGNYGNLSTGSGITPVLGIKLDDYNFEKPDVIKIDVEGAEYQVIKGCEKIIKENRPWIYFEAHETRDLSLIYNFLDECKYYMYWCEVPNFRKNNFKNYKKDIFGNTGLFSILAIPNKIENIVMDPVIGSDDDYMKLIERIKKRNNNKE
jgi:FkbM family methyltransferase